MDIKEVTVVGAGLMGHGIAEVVALAGLKVNLEDAFPEALEKARASIRNSLSRMVKSGKLTQEQADKVFAGMNFTTDLKGAVSSSDMIIEAVPEIPDLKVKLLREVSQNCRQDAIIASNTSNIRISTLAQEVSNPQRLLGLHFFNPPVVLKLVEVIKSDKTSDEVFEETYQFSKKIGKTPIKVLKDTPGFVVNRINAPESLLFCQILDKGLARPEEVDAFGKSQGLPMGPYELMDYVGIDTVVHSLNYYRDALDKEYGKCSYFNQFMDRKELGLKSGKGFYVWENGKALIPKASPSTVIDLMDVLSVEINESAKIIEEGIAKPADIEIGVKLGMNRPFGPISVAEGLTNAEIKRKLQKLSEKFDTKIFYPTKSIEEGKLRELLSGKAARAKDAPAPEKDREVAPAQSLEGEPVSLRKDVEKKVAYLILSNTRNNLINSDVLEGLERHLKALWNDKEINVIVVRGEGKNFSAGAQLTQFFIGLSIGVSVNLWLTSAHNLVPEDMRGRYFALDGVLTSISPASIAAGAFLIAASGILLDFIFSGVMMLVFTLVFGLMKGFWNLDGRAIPETVEMN